ncbi:glycosyltransferase [uncultured Intestinibacter sp.]|uniref:glycosyltransferase family 2 protein n=1 Tax=uncultured Intestinibacter sp. TaxID=1505659 RepID=UPI0027DDFFBB|nr:glycosyltransferase [uncultured Intestinibacter sp.]
MNQKISVIVPIYKVEDYLHRCVDSIINQTYTNLEIILVDDGSPDNCPMICDEYAEKDNRIKVIHKKNGGLSDARNAGLDIATGEYIGFVDSDDYISLSFYERLMNIMIVTESDIVECGVKKFKDSNEICDVKYENLNFSTFSTLEAMQNLITNHILSTTVWNKIYKREIIDKLRFKVGKTNEDDFYTYLAFDNASKITKLNEELYYYLQREDSIMGKRYKLNRLDEIEAKYERLKYIEENYKNLILLAKKDVMFGCLYAYQQLLRNGKKTDIKKGQVILNKYIDKILFTKDDYMNLDIKNKIWMKLEKKSLQGTCRLRNFFNIGV